MASPNLKSSDQPHYHSFLVRIWHGPNGWQGELQTLQSGDQRSFVGLRQLMHHVRRLLKPPARQTPVAPDPDLR